MLNVRAAEPYNLTYAERFTPLQESIPSSSRAASDLRRTARSSPSSRLRCACLECLALRSQLQLRASKGLKARAVLDIFEFTHTSVIASAAREIRAGGCSAAYLLELSAGNGHDHSRAYTVQLARERRYTLSRPKKSNMHRLDTLLRFPRTIVRDRVDTRFPQTRFDAGRRRPQKALTSTATFGEAVIAH